MRWRGREKSQNVDDRRRGVAGRRGVQVGIGGLIAVALFAWISGQNPLDAVMQQLGDTQATTTQAGPAPSAAEEELADFVKVVLKDTEDVWTKIFREELGTTYQKPVLVLFTQRTQSACGTGSASTGPFYCPADNRVYIDLSFYNDLKNRFGAPGDFAMAYVVAHEVGHHVQNLLGTSRQVQAQRGRISQTNYNKLLVRLELQADFYAGLWVHHAEKMKSILEEGDLEEALRAANAIGDDRLQKQARGYVVEDSFTHGTSEQRMRWFSKGVQTGDIRQGDTFAVRPENL